MFAFVSRKLQIFVSTSFRQICCDPSRDCRFKQGQYVTNKYLYDLIVFMNSFLQFSFKPSYYAEFRFRLLSNFSAVHRVSGIKIPIAFYAFSLTTLQTQRLF